MARTFSRCARRWRGETTRTSSSSRYSSGSSSGKETGGPTNPRSEDAEHVPQHLLLVGDGEADLDARVEGLELSQGLGEHEDADGARGADAQPAAHEALEPVDGLAGLVERPERARPVVLQDAAGLGGKERPAFPEEQLHSQLLLEVLDLPRRRRLGERKLGNRPRDSLVPRDDEERAELVEVHGRSPMRAASHAFPGRIVSMRNMHLPQRSKSL